MNIDEAIRKRINEIVESNKTTLTALSLNSNLTPSTIFDFMSGKSKCPKVITIKKICSGADITLEEFFARDYFNGTEDVYWYKYLWCKATLFQKIRKVVAISIFSHKFLRKNGIQHCWIF